ncbi:MAG: hypothetical protein LAO04_06345 [Acidobacteriia bacterium]|nr:hypothetical protein [Terriglobia bacterium]
MGAPLFSEFYGKTQAFETQEETTLVFRHVEFFQWQWKNLTSDDPKKW